MLTTQAEKDFGYLSVTQIHNSPKVWATHSVVLYWEHRRCNRSHLSLN